MFRQVALFIAISCYCACVHGSVDRVIDRMMQKMFIDSLKMSRSISNVPLPRGFWATNRVANYPSYYFNDGRSNRYSFGSLYGAGGVTGRQFNGKYIPYNGNKGRLASSNNIYAPRYTISKSIQLSPMPVLPASSPMAFRLPSPPATASFIPGLAMAPSFHQMTPFTRPTSFRGPLMQFNVKIKKPVNKRSSRNYNRRVNLTANIEKESVGEVIASWNTEMKEISISGSKNETKIKSFHNSGNIHSHLGSGVEGSTLISKIARGDKRKTHSVPKSNDDEGKITLNKMLEKSTQSTNDVRDGDATRYSYDTSKLNQDLTPSAFTASPAAVSFPSTPRSVISFVPRQGKQFTHISN